jgi:hypothetical protein
VTAPGARLIFTAGACPLDDVLKMTVYTPATSGPTYPGQLVEVEAVAAVEE